MSIPFRLHVPRRLYDEMLAHARAELPNECCGLLAGPAGTGAVTRLYRLVNAAASPVEFYSQPESMFEAERDMRRLGIAILAIYHSHPTTDAVPSPTDLARSYGAGVVNVIISLKGPEPAVRGWWLHGGTYREAEWECVDE